MNFALADETTEETPVNENATGTDGEKAEEPAIAEPDKSRFIEFPLGDGEVTEVPLQMAVQSHTQLVSELIEFQKATESTLASVQEAVTATRGKSRKFRKRLGALESQVASVVTQVNELSRVTRTLITVSELAENGTCPECTDAPLERQSSIKNSPQIVCTNPECMHVAATLE